MVYNSLGGRQVVQMLAYNVQSCLNGKLLCHATAIGVKCIMNSPLGDVHKGKILHQPITLCLIRVLVIM